jgi:hypothetical protein
MEYTTLICWDEGNTQQWYAGMNGIHNTVMLGLMEYTSLVCWYEWNTQHWYAGMNGIHNTDMLV